MRSGAWQEADGTHLRVLSRHAEELRACLLDADGHRILHEVPLRREGDYWSAQGLPWPAGSVYAFRVVGPEKDGSQMLAGKGHCQAPPGDGRCLLDPMARWILPAGPRGPLAVLVEECAPASRLIDLQPDRLRARSAPKLRLLYELHPKGFSQLQSAIAPPLRGCIEALADRWSIDYFHRLGVTTLCLMPISAHTDEPRLTRLGLSNYWGYNVLAWSAPHPAYLAACRKAAPGSAWQAGRKALRDTVAALHAAGLEVVLDVVYNHSAELDAEGPTFHLRALDPTLHYRMDAHGTLCNWSGCGNTLDFSQPQVCEWVLQSLRHWVQDYGVDGFRFDLAATASRNRADGGIAAQEKGYFWSRVAADPVLGDCLLIAEPWDLGPQGYLLGQFPAQVLEWNDRYRDEMRGFWIREELPPGRLADRLAGSSGIFAGQKTSSVASVNYLASHDGFTLRDALSYARRHNEANGENNRDGHHDNHSCNHGHEGLEAPDPVRHLRQTKHKALLACLFTSLGTPMLQAGDEWGRSQRGNNNAYCQDNPISWLRWEECDPALLAFARTLMPARQRLRGMLGGAWWQAHRPANLPEEGASAQWLHPQGHALQPAEWEDPAQRALVLHLQAPDLRALHPQAHPGVGARDAADTASLGQTACSALILINAHPHSVSFVLPQGSWRVVFASAAEPGSPAGELLHAQAVLPGYSVSCAVSVHGVLTFGACR